ncbi:MAG: hypothetical protein ACI9VR_005162 [Cognaticolwellia sp.]|jgi:uncharacterized protein with von Willebrand factor type A (vWA) domain
MKPWTPAVGAWRLCLVDGPVPLPELPAPWDLLAQLLPPIFDSWRPSTRGDPASAQRCLALLEEHLEELQILMEEHPHNPAHGELAQALTAEDQEQAYHALPRTLRYGLSPTPTPAQWAVLRTRGQSVVANSHRVWASQRLEEELPRVLERMQEQVQDLGRLSRALELGLGQLGRGSDRTPGAWQSEPIQGLERAGALLRDNPSIRALVDVLGRQAQGGPQRPGPSPIPMGPSEVRGLELGRELSRVLAAELSWLADPDTEYVFWHRYLTGQLMQLEMDQELIRARDHSRVPVGQGRGPILLLLDTSGSMRGEPELLAKALTLAVLRLALTQKRRCLLVAFGAGRQLRTADLCEHTDPALAELLGGRFAGGTDPLQAIQAALDLGAENADLFMVSDGQFVVQPALTERLSQAEQSKGMRCFGLLVGQGKRPGFGTWWRWAGSLSEGAAESLSTAEPAVVP